MPLALRLSLDGGRFDLVQARRLGVATALVLTLGYFLHLTASHKISQADTTQKLMDLQAQVTPQVVRQAGVAGVAITQALALGGVDGFIDRVDHLGYLDALHVAGQLIAATWTTNAGNQVAAAQFGEQLFEVRQGNALALGDIGQGHRPSLRVQGQVEHGGHRVSAFCSQSHGQGTKVFQNGSKYAIPEYLSQL